MADTPLRRLTRAQYDNTVRDLLGLASERAGAFPDDDRAGAFPANPRQVVSDAHVRRFMDAAEAIAADLQSDLHIDALLNCEAATGDAKCAEAFIRKVGARAFRSPLSEGQVNGLLGVYAVGSKNAGFESGIRLVIEAILQAPNFLYHVELKPSVAGAPAKLALSGREVAARLSYYLWQTLPDDELVTAAEQGGLETAEQVQAQAQRLLADPRARATLDSFTSHWLGIHSIEQLARDATLFPSFTPDVARAMRDETLAFASHVFNGQDPSLAALLSAPYSIVPDALLPIYGVARAAGQAQDQPLALDPNRRAGVLTQPSVLAAHSPSDHTSPVKRGVFILNDLLCYETKLPVGIEVPELPPLDPKQTARERFIVHEQPGCAGCHIPIDHIGFTFEHYDSVGAYRESDAGQVIDDSGSLNIGSSQDGPVLGAVAMAQKLLATPELRACVTRQWHRFALGRMEAEADACTQDAAAIEQLRLRRTSVLDFVRNDVRQLEPQIAPADRPKLQAHLAGVEAIEKNLGKLGMGCDSAKPSSVLGREAALADENFPTVIQLQSELLTTALQCGLTRVATLQLSNTDSQIKIPNIATLRSVHEAQHSGTVEDRTVIGKFFVKQLAYLLARLRSVQVTPERTLLDDTLVVMGSEMGIGTHTPDPVPFFVAGGGNAHFKLGRYLSLPAPLQHTRLLTSVLHAMGATDLAPLGSDFNDDSALGPLPGAQG